MSHAGYHFFDVKFDKPVLQVDRFKYCAAERRPICNNVMQVMRSTVLVAVGSSRQTSLTEMTKHYRTIIIVFCLSLVKPIAFFLRRAENPSASEFTGRKIRSSWTWLQKGSKSIFFLSDFNTYILLCICNVGNVSSQCYIG